MLEDYLSKNLKDGEIVLRSIRRYPLRLACSLTICALLIMTDFFLLTVMFQHGGLGVLGFFTLLLLPGLWAYRAWYIWSMNVFLVTDQRVIDIDQKGFFHRVVSETTHRKIQDISYSVRGLWATLLGFGTVSIQTAGAQMKIEIDMIRRPAALQELLTGLQEQTDSDSQTTATRHDE